MAQYASRDFTGTNHDPEPWENENGERTSEHPQSVGHGTHLPVIGHDPRPEFDHVQTNPVSPILEDIRLYRQERLRMNNPKGYAVILKTFNRAAYYGQFVTNDFKRIDSREMMDHARKVLERLVSLEASS